ncbi:CHAT domain containing protein [Tylopilus felleus]
MDSEIEELHERANALAASFNPDGNGTTDCIDKAIVLDRKALELCPPGHPLRSDSSSLLAAHLDKRYKQLGEMADLDDAITFEREALQLRPPGHPCRTVSLLFLAIYLSTRYGHLNRIEDLDETIVLTYEGLSLCSPGHPKRATFLNQHAGSLAIRYQVLGAIEDLEAAISLTREALELILPENPHDRSPSLHNLALYLSCWYDELGGVTDLDEAILLMREAMTLAPPGDYERSGYLNSLSDVISKRYTQLGAREDIDEAIALARGALELRSSSHPDRPASLRTLASHLSERHKQFGEIEDIEEAIVLYQDVLEHRPPGHPNRSASFVSLADCLFARYQHHGSVEDLNQAIALSREALVLRPPGHPDRSGCLTCLAEYLATRCRQLSAMEDLEEAVFLEREALDLCPPGHPDRATGLMNLAARLCVRYQKLEEVADLDQGIILGRDAVALLLPGTPARPIALNNLADSLMYRYKRLLEIQDLNEALVLDREALELRPPGHYLRWVALHNLSIHLFDRYDKLGSMADLDEAIVLLRDALALRQPGHAQQTVSLGVLAARLCTRFKQSSQPRDKEEMFSLWAELEHVPQAVSLYELSITEEWISAAERFQHPNTILAYETSLRYLIQHLSTVPSLHHQLKALQDLTSPLGVDAFSACLRHGSPTKAVELLEQGRGIFWSQLSLLRSSLDGVVASGPAGKELADQFRELTSQIRHSLSESPEGDERDRGFNINTELQRVVSNIRELPGLSRFLLPPLFSDLQQAARGGPVIVVNASKHSCDALVILLDRDPVHIPLQITLERVVDLARDYECCTVHSQEANMTRLLASVLRKLWDDVISPIVHFLRTIYPYECRIWWCPTAEFSMLPFHAAGPYRKGQQNLSDLYISSYTPTLSALIHARRPSPPSHQHERKHFLAVGYSKSLGPGERSSIGVEIDNICRRLDGLVTVRRLEGDECRVSKVSNQLKKHDWVHFACLARPHQEQPLKSAFFLHKNSLSVYRFLQCELENPEFAYLSAGYTTVGAASLDLLDEAINIASAMLFAGFRSVIGTKWAVDDGEAKRIATIFYEYMVDEEGQLNHTRAAFALNETMKKVVDLPLDQRVSFVHLGA